MRVVMQLIIMTFVLTLVACGGGGGGNSTNGPGEPSTKATWGSSNWDEKNWQ